MNLIDIIKTASVQAVSAQKPTDFIIAAVTKFDLTDIDEPVLIQLNQQIILNKQDLIFTDTIYSKIKKDDNVILVNASGNQTFIVIDKAVIIK